MASAKVLQTRKGYQIAGKNQAVGFSSRSRERNYGNAMQESQKPGNEAAASHERMRSFVEFT